MLIHAAEQRILARLLLRAELSVEVENTRARALYERLGYAAVGAVRETWIEERAGGAIAVHEADCILLRKELA